MRRGAAPAVPLAAAPESVAEFEAFVRSAEPRLRRALVAAYGFEDGRDAAAEALAYASLLTDGTPIRLTGQDTERGTFSQRHMVLHDAKTGQTVCPIQSLPQALAPLELPDPDGRAVRLGSLWENGPAVIAFLRHYG